MLMALDAANFFIRNFGALRFGTAAMRPLLIQWQLPEEIFQSTKGRSDQCLSGPDCDPFLATQERATRIFVKRHKTVWKAR
ncbi:hypothetical protein, partial [Desulfovibrio piger]